jgi:hypothetical protein
MVLHRPIEFTGVIGMWPKPARSRKPILVSRLYRT